jgi:hypothetical protein
MNDENRLHELAQRLGAQSAERLDVDATARAVLARLRDEPVERRPAWTVPMWLRAAASVAFLIGAFFIAQRVLSHEQELALHDGAAHMIADDLNDFSETELQDMLAGFDQVLDSTTASPEASAEYDQLNAQQLRAVLRSLEG